MSLNDSGITHSAPVTGSIGQAIKIFTALALYNVVELIYIILMTFKRRRGLYFWSFVVATAGIVGQSVAFLLGAVVVGDEGEAGMWTRITFGWLGWCGMVTGQSVVLYSRLHLVLHHPVRLRAVLVMIIVDALVCHVPGGVLTYAANGSSGAKYMEAYSIYERVQVTIFFLQETIISVLYIVETSKLLRLETTFGSGKRKGMMKHLILVNSIVILLDATILALEFSGMYDVQNSWKALAYSVKLKLEFSILNRLVQLAKNCGSDAALNSGDPSKASGHHQCNGMCGGGGGAGGESNDATLVGTTGGRGGEGMMLRSWRRRGTGGGGEDNARLPTPQPPLLAEEEERKEEASAGGDVGAMMVPQGSSTNTTPSSSAIVGVEHSAV